MRIISLASHLGIAAIVLMGQATSQAGTLSSLQNTGMSSNWNAPPVPEGNPNNAVPDGSWSVYRTGNSSTAQSTSTISNTRFSVFEYSSYLPDLTGTGTNAGVVDSQWIQPTTTDFGNFYNSGDYVYETTFTLPGVGGLVDISGFFKSDDYVYAIQLNGTFIHSPSSVYTPSGGDILTSASWNVPDDWKASQAAHSFSITGSGGLTNTLRFYVHNNGNIGAQGLRVQFNDATFTIPEPSTAALAALGLFGFGAQWLRRRRAANR